MGMSIEIQEDREGEQELVRASAGSMKRDGNQCLMHLMPDDVIKASEKRYRVTRREFERNINGEWIMTIMGREI